MLIPRVIQQNAHFGPPLIKLAPFIVAAVLVGYPSAPFTLFLCCYIAGGWFVGVSWPRRAPAFDDGPRLSIPYYMASALTANEWLPLAPAPDDGSYSTPDDHHTLVNWTSSATFRCPTCCHTSKEGHAQDCRRGRAFVWLEGAMSDATNFPERSP